MSPSNKPSGQGETILVCDDDAIVLKATACLLETEGYQVVRALSAAEAIDAAASHDGEISLVIADVTMPKMNGRQLVQRLLQQRPNLKVIYMSGFTEDVLGLEDDTDPVEFLRKPTPSDALFQHVRRVLDSGD